MPYPFRLLQGVCRSFSVLFEHTLYFSRSSLLRGALMMTRRSPEPALKCALRDFRREEAKPEEQFISILGPCNYPPGHHDEAIWENMKISADRNSRNHVLWFWTVILTEPPKRDRERAQVRLSLGSSSESFKVQQILLWPKRLSCVRHMTARFA